MKNCCGGLFKSSKAQKEEKAKEQEKEKNNDTKNNVHIVEEEQRPNSVFMEEGNGNDFDTINGNSNGNNK